MQTTYLFTQSQDKCIEKLVDTEDVMINHMQLPPGEAVPRHKSNSNVYLLVLRGTLTLLLEEQSSRHGAGTLVHIPFGLNMEITNGGADVLEFFVVKAPGPRMYKSGRGA